MARPKPTIAIYKDHNEAHKAIEKLMANHFAKWQVSVSMVDKNFEQQFAKPRGIKSHALSAEFLPRDFAGGALALALISAAFGLGYAYRYGAPNLVGTVFTTAFWAWSTPGVIVGGLIALLVLMVGYRTHAQKMEPHLNDEEVALAVEPLNAAEAMEIRTIVHETQGKIIDQIPKTQGAQKGVKKSGSDTNPGLTVRPSPQFAMEMATELDVRPHFSGERAQKPVIYRCTGCNQAYYLEKDQTIPVCTCGGTAYYQGK